MKSNHKHDYIAKIQFNYNIYEEFILFYYGH
jgi:hypothetical protein